jgi:hypothetical protein
MYGFPIHGTIDGFSRFIISLRCNTNNRADTVLETYKDGVERNGLPQRVRLDKGGENIEISTFMIQHRAQFVSNPVLMGTSCRNQRIERLWVHVNRAVSEIYMNTFEEWTAIYPHWFPNGFGVKFCLQSLFLRRINEDLDQFVAMWNNHRMTTGNMHNKSPYQMYTEPHHNHGADTLVDEHVYGVDYDEGYDSEEDIFEEEHGLSQLVVDFPVCPFTESQLVVYLSLIRPLTLEDDKSDFLGYMMHALKTMEYVLQYFE